MKDFIRKDPPPALIHRPTLTKDEAALSVSRFDKFAKSHVKATRPAVTTGRYDPALLKTTTHYGPFGSAERFNLQRGDMLAQHLAGAEKLYNLQLAYGDRVQGLPYDTEWSTGGSTFWQRFDGKLLTFAENGFSACGVGLFLQTDVPGYAAVTPVGTYDFNWLSFDNYPGLFSRGGMGMLVYEGGSDQPLRTHTATLWNVGGVHQWQAQQGSGRIGDILLPSAPFGPIPFAPLTFNMAANTRYQVWIWCWQDAVLPPSAAFIAFLTANIPMVTVSLSPPIIIG